MLDGLRDEVLDDYRPAVDEELRRLDATVAASFGDSVDLDRALTADRQGIGGPHTREAALSPARTSQLARNDVVDERRAAVTQLGPAAAIAERRQRAGRDALAQPVQRHLVASAGERERKVADPRVVADQEHRLRRVGHRLQMRESSASADAP